jgi:hypothetical protein
LKDVTAGVLFIVFLLTACGVKSGTTAQLRADHAQPTAPANEVAAQLTEAEEKDLQKLLRATLLFNKTWLRTIDGCRQGSEVNRIDIAETIGKKEGQNIGLRLIVRQNSVIVILDSLHLYLVFPRLHSKGLGPAEERTFCENSYEESVQAQKQYQYFDRSKKDVLGDPGLTAIVDLINARYPSADYDRENRQETRNYLIPTLLTKPVQPYAAWSDEKKGLYQAAIETARNEALLHCKPGKTVKVITPDFDIGDPEIYILLEDPAKKVSVEWIKFNREVLSAEYKAEHAKNLMLPDEISTLVSLIRAKAVRELTVGCPEQPY